MIHFTHWQLHKCVTWVTIHKNPPHEKPWKCGNFRERFPRCLIKTGGKVPHHQSRRTTQTSERVDVPTQTCPWSWVSCRGCTSWNPTRVCCLKEYHRRGLEARRSKMSLSRFDSARQESKSSSRRPSPLRCASRLRPWWTRPQFSTSKLKVRRPYRDLGFFFFTTEKGESAFSAWPQFYTLPPGTASSSRLRLKRPM